MKLSKSTINRERIKFRHKLYQSIKNLKFPDNLVLHWDGVRIEDHILDKKVENMTIKVTGVLNDEPFDQLLNVLQLDGSSAQLISDALLSQIEEYNLKNKIKFLCADTENTNSGWKGGVCVLFEQKFNKKYGLNTKFIALYCRHHIMERFLSNSFRSLFGRTVGDKEQIFTKFEREFQGLDKSGIKPISSKYIDNSMKTELTF